MSIGVGGSWPASGNSALQRKARLLHTVDFVSEQTPNSTIRLTNQELFLSELGRL